MSSQGFGSGLAAVAAAGVLAACAPALADSIEFTSDSEVATTGLGSFHGLMSYESTPLSVTGTLTIMLTNTSDPGNGGAITAFLFNIGGTDENATATLLDVPAPTHPFTQSVGGDLNGAPFGGTFDAGASLRTDQPSASLPGGGIGAGETGVFTFEIEAADAGDLTALSFLAGGDYQFNFIVRFAGFKGGSGDIVPAVVLVPLPKPVAAGIVGLLGAIIVSRRFRHVGPTGSSALG